MDLLLLIQQDVGDLGADHFLVDLEEGNELDAALDVLDHFELEPDGEDVARLVSCEDDPFLIGDVFGAFGEGLVEDLGVVLGVHLGHELLHVVVLDLAEGVAEDPAGAHVGLDDHADLVAVSRHVDAGRPIVAHLHNVCVVLIPIVAIVEVLLDVGGVLSPTEELLPGLLVVEDLDEELRIHLQCFRHVRIQLLQLPPVLLHHHNGLVDLGPTLIELRDVRSVLPQVVPELQVQPRRPLYVLLALPEARLISKLGNNVQTTHPITRAVPIVLTHLLEPVNHKLLIYRRVELRGLHHLCDRLGLFVHPFHQEEGVLDLEAGAGGELLDAGLVHVLRMVQQQLEVILILRHLYVLLEVVLVLGLLGHRVLVELQLAVCPRAHVFMVVDVAFEQNCVPSVAFFGRDQVDEVPDLLRNFFTFLEIVEVLEEELVPVILREDDGANDQGQPQEVQLERPIEVSVLKDLRYEEGEVVPEEDAVEDGEVLVHFVVVVGPVVGVVVVADVGEDQQQDNDHPLVVLIAEKRVRINQDDLHRNEEDISS
mmetsp:Transcript_29897/g.29064  ORF Transcript_29897/g.29064 Transcript_29897/m.29064 type:complete len:539 (-) Transcript_29897:679-2295(-)